MKRTKLLWKLFFSMLKIGLFTFGGGYAMIALIENEFVTKKKWIGKEEFLDMVAISESTPGPLAINGATYIGYKIAGVLGAAAATIAVCIPSFVIIYAISLFFDEFLEFTYAAYAFRGIQVCVIYLILSAGWKMFREMKKTAFHLVIFSLTLLFMVAFSIFAVDFSSIFYILISAAAGVACYLIASLREEGRNRSK